MSDHRRTGRRAFRPGINGRLDLESRLLLSTLRAQVAAKAAKLESKATVSTKAQFAQINYHTANGGKIAKIRDTDGEIFDVVLTGPGHVRAQPQSGGRAKLIVDGSTPETVIAINKERRVIVRGTAHVYPKNAAAGDNILHVGDIQVTTGRISQILAYRTAELSGTVVIGADSPVDRIAFYSYQPGANIVTGGDLNTFDAFTDATFGGTGGLQTGRDLNWVNIGGNLSLNSGSSLLVGRDLGLVAQPVKGSDPGGQGGLVGGNVVIEPNASWVITRALQAPFVINGFFAGASRFSTQFGASNIFVRGAIIA